MATIKYNKDGWVCDRFPYNLKDYFGEMEVDDATYMQTMATGAHFAWRVVGGLLVNERYEETPHKEWVEDRIRDLKRHLRDTDYMAIKFAEGEFTEQEYAPVRAQRAAWRAEINELEAEL